MLGDAKVQPMLPVKDLGSAQKFYEQTLGLKKEGEMRRFLIIFVYLYIITLLKLLAHLEHQALGCPYLHQKLQYHGDKRFQTLSIEIRREVIKPSNGKTQRSLAEAAMLYADIEGAPALVAELA